MGKQMYVECCKSKEKGTLYYVLKVDFGYRVANVTMETDLIAEFAELPISAIYSLKFGDKLILGDFVKAVKK